MSNPKMWHGLLLAHIVRTKVERERENALVIQKGLKHSVDISNSFFFFLENKEHFF